jgi:hypothetical protein
MLQRWQDDFWHRVEQTPNLDGEPPTSMLMVGTGDAQPNPLSSGFRCAVVGGEP